MVIQSKPEGIYFGLSNEEYHNDGAIGCSNIKDLLISPLDYWWNSPFNPEKESKPTKAMELGTALHCLLMEPKKFEQDYIVLPKLEIDSDFYRTESQKSDFLQNFQLFYQQKFKKLIPEGIIKDEDGRMIVSEEDYKIIKNSSERFYKIFEYIGARQQLSKKDFKHITTAVDRVRSLSTANELLKSGVSEVSIFWKDQETGLMCKCRHDYLTPWHSVDYKSMADNIKKSKIGKTIAEYEYYLQAAWYSEGVKRIREFLIKNNIPTPQGVNQNWWKEFLKSERQDFFFIFQSKKQPFTTRLRNFTEEVLEASLNKCKRGLIIYQDSFAKYGAEKWKDEEENYIETMGFNDMPAYIQYDLTCQV